MIEYILLSAGDGLRLLSYKASYLASRMDWKAVGWIAAVVLVVVFLTRPSARNRP